MTANCKGDSGLLLMLLRMLLLCQGPEALASEVLTVSLSQFSERSGMGCVSLPLAKPPVTLACCTRPDAAEKRAWRLLPSPSNPNRAPKPRPWTRPATRGDRVRGRGSSEIPLRVGLLSVFKYGLGTSRLD